MVITFQSIFLTVVATIFSIWFIIILKLCARSYSVAVVVLVIAQGSIFNIEREGALNCSSIKWKKGIISFLSICSLCRNECQEPQIVVQGGECYLTVK